MGGFMTTVGGIVAPIAVSFLAEGIHILYKKIKERDRIVRHANRHIKRTKSEWEMRLQNVTEEDPTAGELEEIRIKEKIVNKMRYYRKPRKISSRKGYSINLNYSFEVVLSSRLKTLRYLGPNLNSYL